MPPKKKDAGAKEGDEKEMGGIRLRAVKAHDGTIVFKPVSQLDRAPAKPNEKQWLQEKQRAVVDARVQEKRTTDMKQKKAAADIYGRDEIYQRGGGGGRGRGKGRKGGSGGGAHVKVSNYLSDLRQEEAAARLANMHISKPGQYQIIKESLDAEEEKYKEASLKAREEAYSRNQRRLGVRSQGGAAEDDSSEEEKEMTEEEFKRLAQQRAQAADKELARDGVKLRAPIPKREEEEAKARAKMKEKQTEQEQGKRNKGKKKGKGGHDEVPAPKAYVDHRSADAHDAAAAEAQKWAELKEQSEEMVLSDDRKASGKGGKGGKGKKNRNGKGKGGRGKGKGEGAGRSNAGGRGLVDF